VLSDQTPAHDPLSYVPQGLSMEEAERLRAQDPDRYIKMAMQSMKKHVQLMLELQARGAVTFEYGNNLRKQAYDAGLTEAFKIPGQMEFMRPLFEEGRGPFRWTSLVGDPKDIYKLDEVLLQLFSRNERLARWIRAAHEYVKFQGLPARVVYLGYGERALFGKVVSPPPPGPRRGTRTRESSPGGRSSGRAAPLLQKSGPTSRIASHPIPRWRKRLPLRGQ